jgi:hypothetical protein
MGFLSIIKSVGQEVASMTRKAFRDPIKRAKRRAIKSVLKSESMYRMQNAAVRFVASEVLLAVIVGLASLVTARGVDAHVYNYVVPCVVSGMCTQFLREPLNSLCDDYTQPIAQKTQQLIANNCQAHDGYFAGHRRGRVVRGERHGVRRDSRDADAFDVFRRRPAQEPATPPASVRARLCPAVS